MIHALFYVWGTDEQMEKWVQGTKNNEFEKAAYFLWIGNDAVYIWNRKNGQRECIEFAVEAFKRIPNIPKFHYVYDDIVYYEKEAGKIFARKFFSRRCVCMAVPDDISWMEQRALTDFVYRITKIEQLFLCSHSMALCGYHAFMKTYTDCIVATQGCRCYCITLMRNGEAEEQKFLDIHTAGREELMQELRGFAGNSSNKRLEIYYPGIEKNRIFYGIGMEVSFDGL